MFKEESSSWGATRLVKYLPFLYMLARSIQQATRHLPLQRTVKQETFISLDI